jgi:hypothetical protein
MHKRLRHSLNTDLLIVTFIFQSKKSLFTYNLSFNTVATETSAAIAQSVYSLKPVLVLWSFVQNVFSETIQNFGS